MYVKYEPAWKIKMKKFFSAYVHLALEKILEKKQLWKKIIPIFWKLAPKNEQCNLLAMTQAGQIVYY